MKKENPIRKLILWRLSELVIILVLSILGIWLFGQVQEARRELAISHQSLEHGLDDAEHEGVLESELTARSHDIGRIKENIPTQSQIAVVIGAFEQAANSHSVTISIPRVAEKQLVAEDGNLIEQSGPFREVEVVVVAVGQPKDLLQYFHTIEHLPFLVGATDFTLAQELGGRARGSSPRLVGDDNGEYQIEIQLLLVTNAGQ